MENSIQIKKINSNNDLKKVLDIIENKYGKGNLYRLYDENKFYREFDSIEKIIGEDINFNNFIELTSSYIIGDKIISLDIDLKNCIMKINEITPSFDENIEVNIKELTDEEIQTLTSDENCDFFMFDNGTLVKYSYEDGLYYRIDENRNWIKDNWILSWFSDSEHNYEVLKKKEEGKRL